MFPYSLAFREASRGGGQKRKLFQPRLYLIPARQIRAASSYWANSLRYKPTLKGPAIFTGRTRQEQKMCIFTFFYRPYRRNVWSSPIAPKLPKVSNETKVTVRSGTNVCLSAWSRSAAASKLCRVATQLHCATWSHVVGRCRSQTLCVWTAAGPYLCCWGSLESSWDPPSLLFQLKSWLCPLAFENRIMKAHIGWEWSLFIGPLPLVTQTFASKTWGNKLWLSVEHRLPLFQSVEVIPEGSTSWNLVLKQLC